MKGIMKYLAGLAAVLALSMLPAFGQTIDELNAEIARAESEIAKNEQLLKEVSKSKRANQTQVKLLQAKITSREKIVKSLGKQIKLINNNIEAKNRNISNLQTQITSLKKEYAGMLRLAYKNYKLNNTLLFLFSSEDFNTATQRINFMRRYNDRLSQKAVEIDRLSKNLEADVVELNMKQVALDKTKTNHSKEINALEGDRKELASVGQKLQSEEKQINQELRAKREQKRKAQLALQRIINEETRKRQRSMSDAERRAITELSGRFDQNRGRMLMPVNGGIIIEHFGKHPHPTQPNMTVDNKGINIAAPKGADVFAVFEGTVARVMFINGLNNCVMLRHGDYVTVYGNLASVNVRAGEKVIANRKIGSLSTNDDPEEHQLHFELWYSTQNIDPEDWLAH